jgi:hypothetical protein
VEGYIRAYANTILLARLSMTLNTLGPTALIALGVPLLGIWNVAPLTVVPDSSSPGEPRLRATPAQEAQAPPLSMSQARVAVLVDCSRDIAGAHPPAQLSSSATMSRCLLGYGIGVGQIVSRITRMFVLPEQSAGSSSLTAAEGQQ